MEAKKGLTIDDYGRPIIQGQQLVELLLAGKSVDNLLLDTEDEDVRLYISNQEDLLNKTTNFQSPEAIDFDDFHSARSNNWKIPEEYKTLDVKSWLLARCSLSQEKDRVEEEYEMYEERGLQDLLRFFIYLVDHFRSKNLLWGVGRGSSVSSYILYLIGIHRVDSLKYNLSIKEFLK